MSPDELTGLLSRAEVLDRLQSELALASQKNQPITTLYIDCNQLLRINNTYGHLAGDAFIRLVAGVLAEVARDRGVAGRIGGDEFLLVLSGQPLDKALELAEAVRSGVEGRPLEIDHQGTPLQLPVGVTIGVSFFAAGSASITVDELVRQAYDALLRAKQPGGNAIVLYSEIEERDPLTNLLKRAGLVARFEQVREAAGNEHTSIAIINLDIDEFDAINKQFGHYAGDEVLRRVALVLTNNLKEVGFVGRYAGDEFVVILPDSRAETAFVLAEEVRRAIESSPVEVQIGEKKSRINIQVSAGVAEYPSDGNNWESLFRRSDEALFRAKRLGRNRVCLPTSSQMITKTSYYTQTQLEKLAGLAQKTGKTEAYLLREGLDDLLRKYKV